MPASWTGAGWADGGDELTDNEVEVFRGSAIEASLVASKLEAFGIPFLRSASTTPYPAGPLDMVAISVPSRDADDARAVLQEEGGNELT